MAVIGQAWASPSTALVPCARELDEDGALAEVMHEVSMALQADSLIVSWRERDGDQPVLLFSDGAAGDPHVLMETAGSLAAANDVAPQWEWALADHDVAGGKLTASIPTSGGVVTIIGRFNRLGAATRARARQTVAPLLPMVRPFVRLWAARLAVLSRVRGLTAAVNKSDVGILLVDRDGQLLFANAAAEGLLAEADGIRRHGRMLSGGRLADTLKLQAAIEHVITARDEGDRETRAPVVALTRKARRPLLAAIIAGEGPTGRAEESAAIIHLCDPAQDLTSLVEPACKLYGLSPVETRLACLLAQGVSLADAADTMRVREQTARSYLKQIFLKTETRRQAELVWLMLRSSVRTTSATLTRLI